MESELRKKIDNLSTVKKSEALEYLLTNTRHNRAVKVLEKTIDDIITYLDDNNLVEKLSDKDDKSFDRGKVLLKDLLSLTTELEAAKTSILNVEEENSFKKKASSNSISALLDELTEG